MLQSPPTSLHLPGPWVNLKTSPPDSSHLLQSYPVLTAIHQGSGSQPISHRGCHLPPEHFLGARELACSHLGGDRADGVKGALSQQHREIETQVSSSLGARPLALPPWKPASPKRLRHLWQMDAPGAPPTGICQPPLALYRSSFGLSLLDHSHVLLMCPPPMHVC